jgi:hypothetical protein
MDDTLLGIEEEFRKSWDSVQSNYVAIADKRGLYRTTFVPLIEELREHGYDEWFRAQSGFLALRLSRSIRSGMLQDKSFAQFKLTGDKQTQTLVSVVGLICGKRFRLMLEKPSLSYEVKLLLELLMMQPIE